MTSAPAHPIGRWRLPDQIDVIEPLTDGHIIEGIVAIAANPGVAGVDAYLEPAAAP
ncbi:hypothetical protein [Achromobacter sp. NFACC18-2]|uniref:hypothetical protein n=1 Tax=Achromobacter sp. NFACC18-2 TaxID=1564112 RepID=UPI001587706A|nr:hypothetical protein [Achromobacter sp. NFACC18-2]